MTTRTSGPYITVTPTQDGVFRAVCPGIQGVFAEGTTPQEAEQNLLEILESRTEAKGPLGAREAVELHPDADFDAEEV